jgi:hypothetical protein
MWPEENGSCPSQVAGASRSGNSAFSNHRKQVVPKEEFSLVDVDPPLVERDVAGSGILQCEPSMTDAERTHPPKNAISQL